MLYNDKVNQALRLCYEMHKGQLDKSDVPYVFHPFMVANMLREPATTNEIITALLHDIFEDCPNPFENEMFAKVYDTLDDEVKIALDLLTHYKCYSYDEYISRIAENKIATKVKCADLGHNMMLSRLDQLTQKDTDRYMKYRKALSYLRDNGTWS